MPDLLALQSDFASCLRGQGDTGIETARRWIAGDADHVARRLAIYRANILAAAERALSGAYPVIRQVLGAPFLHDLAREVQRAMPSTSGDLADFGADLASFLEDFEPTRAMPWLPDLARLEWAVHRATGAADATPWDLSTLAAVDPDRQGSIRWRWAPGLAVLASPYPIVRVWTIHQPGFDGAFTVDWDEAQRGLVAREGHAVAVSSIGAGDAAFIERSLQGGTMDDAVATALDVDLAFDLGALLARLVATGALDGFTLDKEPT
jgi:hypothetical protein